MKLLFKIMQIFFVISLFLVQSSYADETTEVWDLKDIVVTGTKTPHPLGTTPVYTNIITKKDISRSSSQTVGDLLRYVPGFFVRGEDTPGITSWRTSIRGLSINDGYGLVLVDGERVKGGGMGDYGIGVNQIPPQLIERIEIVKGPVSTLYGSDALAGVINIITKPIPKKPIYGFQASYGSHHLNTESLYWGRKNKSLGLLFNAVREESDMGEYGIRSGRKESYKNQRLDTKISYDLNKNVTFKLKIYAEEQNRKRNYLTKTTTRETDYHKYRLSPEINIKFNDNSTLLLHSYYYDWDFKTKEYGTPSGFTPRNGDMYYKNIETRYTRSINKSNLATIGIQYLDEKLDYNLSNKTLLHRSGYVQDEIKFRQLPLYLVAGVRFENHSEYGSELCPKLNLMYEVSSVSKIRGSIGRGFKSPTIRQAYYNEPFQHGTYWYLSNSKLNAETSWGYSLGIESELTNKFHYNITLFRNDIKDKIVKVNTNKKINGLPVVTYKNAEEAYTKGVEVGIKWLIIKDLLWTNFGYTYTDTENKDTKKELTYVPRNNIAGHLIIDNKYLGFTFDVGIQWVDKMYTNLTNTKKTNSYSVVDFKLTKSLSKNSNLSISGNNIFNSEYGEPDRDWRGATWIAEVKVNF